MELKKEYYEKLIEQAIIEDIGDGDITTEAIIPSNQKSKAVLISKAEGILCGIDVFCAVMTEIDPTLKINTNFKDGDVIKNGDIILNITGKTSTILKAERTALNFLQRMSGIASKTRKYVDLIKEYPTKILDTRKTIPAYRMLDKYAVFTGGGTNHRIGLYDMFLIKENHIKSAGEITVAIERARNFMKGIKIEVETTNLEEVREACLSNPDVIMLDNMDNDMVMCGMEIIKKHNETHSVNIKTEVSGNITKDRLIDIGKMNVDFVSMGELTHSVSAFDFSLIVKATDN